MNEEQINAALALATEARDEALAKDKQYSAKYWQGYIDGAEKALASLKPSPIAAAAPDLLAALIELASGHSMAGEEIARKAIAKATGGAQ